MIRALALFGMALLGAVAAQAQSYPLWQSTNSMVYVPSAATAVTATTKYVTQLDLTDPTGAAVTVTVSDGNGVLWTIPMGGSNPTVLSWPFAQGVPFYGGITWQASVANTVKGHFWGTN